MGPRAGFDSGKSSPTGIRSPDRPARSSVAIPTKLPGPQIIKYGGFIAYWKNQCLIKRRNSKKMALHSEVVASSSVIIYLIQFDGER